jgi:hypothetical protein
MNCCLALAYDSGAHPRQVRKEVVIAVQRNQDRINKIIPTPEEWAEEQLKNAPIRSTEWAKRVAQIYGLEVNFDEGEMLS